MRRSFSFLPRKSRNCRCVSYIAVWDFTNSSKKARRHAHFSSRARSMNRAHSCCPPLETCADELVVWKEETERQILPAHLNGNLQRGHREYNTNRLRKASSAEGEV